MKAILADASHYTLGILAAFSSVVSIAFPILLASLFIIYELNEDWHLHDKAFQDIREFLIGFAVAIGIILVWLLISY